MSFSKAGEMLLETQNDLLIPGESYYELPTGVRFKVVGATVPIFVCLMYQDPDTAFKLVNHSTIVWPKTSFTELVLQLWNPSHTSQAIPEGTTIVFLRVGEDVSFQEVDA